MSKRKFCIVGGSGFVGRHLAARLSAAGHEVCIITRRRERHKDLLVLPTLRLVEGDVYNVALLQREFHGQDAVINLVGILNETGHSGRGFERAHVELSGKIIKACRNSGVQRLLHMSALHASADGPSHYLRTKAKGEALVIESGSDTLHVTAFRPSVIFGHDDSFTNRFATLLRLLPGFLPLACADARFQPIHVEDVVSAFVAATDDRRTFGQSYNLCGPEVYSLRQIVEYLVRLMGIRCRIVPLGELISRLQAEILEYVPGKPFSRDNYLSLQIDSVCDAPFPDVFGITPSRLEDIVPRYLGPSRSLRYARYRSHAG